MTTRWRASRMMVMGWRLLMAGAFVAAGAAGVVAESQNQGSGGLTLEAARKFLEGRWSLMSYEVIPPGKSAIKLSGAGTLTYDAYSNLDMQIRVDDPKVAEALAAAGVPVEKGVISTTGRTVIDLQGRTLTYILQGQGPLVPVQHAGPLALSRPRHWLVDGKTLTLTTLGDDGKPVSIGRWQKQ